MDHKNVCRVEQRGFEIIIAEKISKAFIGHFYGLNPCT